VLARIVQWGEERLRAALKSARARQSVKHEQSAPVVQRV